MDARETLRRIIAADAERRARTGADGDVELRMTATQLAALAPLVSSCVTCRFMRPPATPVQYATCGAHDDTEPNARFGPTSPADSEIWVTPDFGCVQWEPKA